MRHHFLWRIRRALPPAGYVGVFNRSHYEDVLVVRVEGLVPKDVWQKRYDEINRFENRQLADGVTLIKVMLHISKDEQKQRLLDRLADPTKRWKYNLSDLDSRLKWDDYQEAYETALGRCNSEAAPWYVVPADRKWYRNWAVAQLVRETLEGMNLEYTPADVDIDAERARNPRQLSPVTAHCAPTALGGACRRTAATLTVGPESSSADRPTGTDEGISGGGREASRRPAVRSPLR